jgi:hypothetical protein
VFASVPRSGVDNTPIEIYQTGRDRLLNRAITLFPIDQISYARRTIGGFGMQSAARAGGR